MNYQTGRAASDNVSDPKTEVGRFHRFGSRGVVYEVIGVGERSLDGDREMRIRVLESGEVTDYPLSCVLRDPRED
jgi:hypothetical protein